MVKIIDIGVGNLLSLHFSLLSANIDNKIITKPEQISDGDTIILPGVGSIRLYMKLLKKKNFEKKIKHHFKNNFKLIGICIGMHALSEFSSEDGGINCMNIIKTKVVKMTEGQNNGWNKISLPRKYFKKRINGRVFYNHEYGMIKNNFRSYSINIPGKQYISFIKKKNFYGLQFHPEKSQKTGIEILKRLIS